MFKATNEMLKELRSNLSLALSSPTLENLKLLNSQWLKLSTQTDNVTKHLSEHLLKEETECMPLIQKNLSNSEMQDLVGDIMGTRSSDQMRDLLNLAIQELPKEEKADMVAYMNKAMEGTFFEKWLSTHKNFSLEDIGNGEDGKKKLNGGGGSTDAEVDELPGKGGNHSKSARDVNPPTTIATAASSAATIAAAATSAVAGLTQSRSTSTSSEIEKVIRSIALDHSLTQKEKNATIQALRNAMWESEKKISRKRSADADDGEGCSADAGGSSSCMDGKYCVVCDDSTGANGRSVRAKKNGNGVGNCEQGGSSDNNADVGANAGAYTSSSSGGSSAGVLGMGGTLENRRNIPPKLYFYKHEQTGKKVLHEGSAGYAEHARLKAESKGKSEGGSDVILVCPDGSVPPSIPLFSTEELAPTYHDKERSKLGCPHYARRCKLRHPVSGKLYTCRLCCDQYNAMVSRQTDLALDRNAVCEILCMVCGALQPSSQSCANEFCTSPVFSKYFCKICNLFDDSHEKKIYHCPFCNVCRSGVGLGVDYRHCMRCNACVSTAVEREDGRDHVCIPQTLQGNCPVCAETMFQR